MKHIIVFALLIFLPLLLVYIYQRSNNDFSGFKWTIFNDLGVTITILLFLFILFAEQIAPSFVIRFDEGWTSRRSNEYTYALWWFIGLLLITFPHVCKRSTWPLFPTAIERKSLHKTMWYRLTGLAVIAMQAYQLVQLSH